jgi:hypothetical protein
VTSQAGGSNKTGHDGSRGRSPGGALGSGSFGSACFLGARCRLDEGLGMRWWGGRGADGAVTVAGVLLTLRPARGYTDRKIGRGTDGLNLALLW